MTDRMQYLIGTLISVALVFLYLWFSEVQTDQPAKMVEQIPVENSAIESAADDGLALDESRGDQDENHPKKETGQPGSEVSRDGDGLGSEDLDQQ